MGFGIAIILFVPSLNNKIIVNLLLANRTFSLNDISSGRLTAYKHALEILSLSPISGIGNYYVDSLFILVLTTFGTVGFVLFLPYLSCPYFLSQIIKRNNYKLVSLITSFEIILFINSLFEAYTPYGPGATTFIFWLILGMQFKSNYSLNNIFVPHSFKNEIKI